MGGDEVSEKCWNSSDEIKHFMKENRWGLRKSSFLELWNYFQTRAQEKAYKVNIPESSLFSFPKKTSTYNSHFLLAILRPVENPSSCYGACKIVMKQQMYQTRSVCLSGVSLSRLGMGQCMNVYVVGYFVF